MNIQEFKAPTGMPDILPDEMPYWNRLEEAIRSLMSRYGYREIRTSMFEETRLFTRSVGEATDIVEKQMYSFTGEGNEDRITLRPEMTASVVRALVEHQMYKQKTLQKFFYIGPMFRKERPQKGRYRQFHQLGIEAFGSGDPLIDAETILVFHQLLSELGIAPFSVKLNSIGCLSCRGEFRSQLKSQLQARLSQYCPDCRKRFERNPFRVLDCKVESCVRLNQDLPRITDRLCQPCRDHFSSVRSTLDRNGISYQLEPNLVRGLDYYTRTVYEVTSDLLGSQDSLGGGGRYDNLVHEIGGPEMGAVGFAAGMERIIMVMKENKKETGGPPALSGFFIVTIGPEQKAEAFHLLAGLRRAGFSGDMDYEGRSVKAQMREATRLGARFTLILGPDEVNRKIVKVKEMQSGEERSVNVGEIVPFLKGRYER